MDPALDLDPYRPPRAEPAPAVPVLDPDAPLASRWQRFGGSLIDVILDTAAWMIIYLGVAKADVEAKGGNDLAMYTQLGPWGYLTGGAVLTVAMVQWYLIVRRGQSLGKMVARTRIVRMNGAPADFACAVVLRDWVFSAPSLLLPIVGISMQGTLGYVYSALMLVEVLFIYRADRRCLHDHLANTKVIDVSSRAAAPAQPTATP